MRRPNVGCGARLASVEFRDWISDNCIAPTVADLTSTGVFRKEDNMNWYLDVLKKYAVFSGRATRKEYWCFFLINTLVSIVLIVADIVIGSFNAAVGIGLLSGIYTLAVLIPGVAVTLRRLHDTDRSGWWILIAVIPFVGAIVLLVFLVQDSKSSENQYGSNPKGAFA
jgi:uncharacterized membrane protein YhaH (DUF805 family)